MSFFIGEYSHPGMMTKSLEKDAREELEKWQDVKRQAASLEKLTVIKAGERLEAYLKEYVRYHNECKKASQSLEERRKDHWDILSKKCSEDPMFKNLWDELMVLLKLEDNN